MSHNSQSKADMNKNLITDFYLESLQRHEVKLLAFSPKLDSIAVVIIVFVVSSKSWIIFKLQNGKFAVVGTYDGRCIFYSTDQLKYYTMIHVRSARGKNAQGRKVTGIEPMPGEDKILVTSNDSRIRLYDLRDLSLSCKYKGYVNSSSQIRASFR